MAALGFSEVTQSKIKTAQTNFDSDPPRANKHPFGSTDKRASYSIKKAASLSAIRHLPDLSFHDPQPFQPSHYFARPSLAILRASTYSAVLDFSRCFSLGLDCLILFWNLAARVLMVSVVFSGALAIWRWGTVRSAVSPMFSVTWRFYLSLNH